MLSLGTRRRRHPSTYFPHPSHPSIHFNGSLPVPSSNVIKDISGACHAISSFETQSSSPTTTSLFLPDLRASCSRIEAPARPAIESRAGRMSSRVRALLIANAKVMKRQKKAAKEKESLGRRHKDEDVRRRDSVTLRLNIGYVHTSKLKLRTPSYSESSSATRLAVKFYISRLSAKAGKVSRTPNSLAKAGSRSRMRGRGTPVVCSCHAHQARIRTSPITSGCTGVSLDKLRFLGKEEFLEGVRGARGIIQGLSCIVYHFDPVKKYRHLVRHNDLFRPRLYTYIYLKFSQVNLSI